MRESKDLNNSETGYENKSQVGKQKKVSGKKDISVSEVNSLQTLLQSIGIALIVLDNQLRVSLFSPAAADIFNITNEHLGAPLSGIETKLINSHISNDAKSVLETGKASESIVRTSDNASFVMTLSPSFAANKKIDSITISFTNITQRIQEEEKLACDRNNMAETLATAQVGWGRWNWITGTGDWNETAKQIMDFAEGDDPSTVQGWLNRIHPDDRASIQTRISETIAQKSDFKADYRIITKKGKIRYINSSGNVTYNDAGIALSSTGLITDTTAHSEKEDALRHSEEKYYQLFNSIDEGYCVIELLFDENEKPFDYRYLEVNEAFEQQTSLANVVGKTSRQLLPFHEQIWYDTYGKIALTGEPLRFTNEAKELHRYFDVYAFRMGELSERKVAVLFKDISDQRIAESNLAFLSEISDDLIYIEDVAEMVQSIGTKISSYLKLSYCVFVRVDKTGNLAEVLYDQHTANTPGFAGTYDLSAITTSELQLLASKGESLVVNDINTDPRVDASNYRELQIGSFISMPLIVNGEWKFFMSVSHSAPYSWRDDEVNLVKELTSRIWTTINRKRAEAKLRLSEEKYRTIFNSIDEAFFIAETIVNSDGIVVDCTLLELNPAFEKLTGITTADIGKTAGEIRPNLNRWWIDTFTSVLITGEAMRFQQNLQASQKWLDIYATPLGENETRKFAVVLQDITASKQAEIELSQSEERLRLTIAAGRAGTCDLNYQTGKAYCNPTRYKMYGISPVNETVDASELMACIHPDDVAYVLNEFETGIHQTGKHHEEYRVVHPDGTIKWISESGQVVEWKNGEPLRIISILFDITERKTEEKQKDDFFNIASHELKTPVTSIKAFTQILEYMFRAANDTYSADLMNRLDKQVDRLTNLVKDMLDTTKVREGQLALSFEDFNIVGLTKEIVQEIQHTTSHHQILLSASSVPLVYGDKDRLRQVITNLFSNAIKYTPVKDLTDPANIIVKLSEKNGKIYLSVQDSGIGMSTGTVARLFQRFFRSDDPDTHTYPGLGLGLYISKEIMKRHGGDILVQSEKGRGSTFTMVLPLSQK